MKKILVVAALACACVLAKADVVYTSPVAIDSLGPGYYLDPGGASVISSQFTVSSTTTLNGIAFGMGVAVGSSGLSVKWKIGTSFLDGSLGDGDATIGPAIYLGQWASPNVYDVYRAEFDLPSLTLAAGTYYLTLDQGVATTWEMYWESDVGTSNFNTGLTAASENGGAPSTRMNDVAFEVLGTPLVTSVPEPASLALLGLGLAGVVAFRRRHS